MYLAHKSSMCNRKSSCRFIPAHINKFKLHDLFSMDVSLRRKRTDERGTLEPVQKKFKPDTNIEAKLQNIHDQMALLGKKEGVPFTFNMEGVSTSCVIWKEECNEDLQILRKQIELCSELKDVFSPPICVHYCPSTFATAYFFNPGVKDFQVDLHVSKMNTYSSTSFCSLKTDEFGNVGKHSLLSLINLAYGMTNWFIKAGTNVSLALNSNMSPQAAATMFTEHFWIKNGTGSIQNRNPPEILCSPTGRGCNECTHGKKACVDEELVLNTLMIMCRKMLKLTRCRGKKIPDSAAFVNPIHKFFTSMTVDPCKTLNEFAAVCKKAVNWFYDHDYWPEIVWKNDDIWDINSKRCLDLIAESEEGFVDFDTKVRLTGVATLGKNVQEEQDDIFKVKPLFVATTWDSELGIQFKIVLNQQVPFKSLFAKMNTLDDIGYGLALQTISKLPESVYNFITKVDKLGKCLPSLSIIERTYLYKNGKNYVIGINLYGHEEKNAILIHNAYPYFSRRTLPEGIKLLLEAGDGSTVWEIGCWLVSLYSAVFKTADSVSSYVAEYLSNSRPRIYLLGKSPFGSDESFVYLIANILSRNDKPTLSQLIDNKYLKRWSRTDDFTNVYRILSDEEAFEDNNDSEHSTMEMLTENNLEDFAFARTIRIRTEWEEMNIESCKSIVKAFTDTLDKPCDTMIRRTWRSIPVGFTFKNTPDAGIGEGVFREALTMYCNAVNKLGTFKRHHDTKNMDKNQWYALGVLINHCVIRRYKVGFELPRSFYKMMAHGENARYNISDLAAENFDIARSLIDMLFLTNDELESMFIDFDDVDDYMNGSVTSHNVNHYVDLKIRTCLLEGYSTGNIRALNRGYTLSYPEYQPTPNLLYEMFSLKKHICPTNLLSYFAMRQPDGVDFCHGRKCFSTMCEEGNERRCNTDQTRTCVFSCFADFIHDSEQKELACLLRFFTGCELLDDSEEYVVELLHSKEPRFPKAKTCDKTIIFYSTEEKGFVDKSKFYETLSQCLKHNAHFGFV